jgi:alkylation response protein AidB-like acyl-CoA dehydrogenase
MIDQFGDEEQRRKYLPGLARMEQLASYRLTEPAPAPTRLLGINQLSLPLALLGMGD